MNRIRHSKEVLYNKIYHKYIENIYNIDDILLELQDKNIKYILFVLNGIRYGIINSGKNKLLIQEYDKYIKKYSNINEDNIWSNIIKKANYYIVYKKHMKNYLRNRALILLYICIETKKSSEILNLKYSKDCNIKEGYYFLPDIKKLLFNNQYIDIDKKLFIALKEYTKNFENDQILFKINKTRLSKIIKSILDVGINTIKEERLKIQFK
jgi:hypothetical protein